MAESHEALVPRNLPHGDRIKLEAAMDAGGVSKNPTPADNVSVLGGGGVPSPPLPSAAPQRQSTDLASFDVFANREPVGAIPPATVPGPVSLFQTRLTGSTNPAVAYYLGRATEFTE